jgi:hypothetical protein
MTRATEKAKKPLDVNALIKGMKDNARNADRARVEAVDAEARVSTEKKGPEMIKTPRAKGGQSKVGNSPKVTPKKKSSY